MSSFTTHTPSSVEGPPGIQVSHHTSKNIRIRNCNDFRAIVEEGDNITVHHCHDFEVKIEDGATVSVHGCSDFQIVHVDDDEFTDTSFSGDTVLDHLEEDLDQAVANSANGSTGAVNEASSSSNRDVPDPTTALSATPITTLANSDTFSPKDGNADEHTSNDPQQDNRQTTSTTRNANSNLNFRPQGLASHSPSTATRPILIPTRKKNASFHTHAASLTLGHTHPLTPPIPLLLPPHNPPPSKTTSAPVLQQPPMKPPPPPPARPFPPTTKPHRSLLHSPPGSPPS